MKHASCVRDNSSSGKGVPTSVRHVQACIAKQNSHISQLSWEEYGVSAHPNLCFLEAASHPIRA